MPWYAWLLLGAVTGAVVFYFLLWLYFARDYIGGWPRRRAHGSHYRDLG